MISIPLGIRVLVATRPVNFRKEHMASPRWQPKCSGKIRFSAAIAFRAKRADRIKILIWDGSGLMLVWKELQQGAFRWPPVIDGAMRLSAVEFAALFDGPDWTRVQASRS